MSDESKKGFLDGSHPKHTFLLGLFIGIAVISFISFVSVLVFMSNTGAKAEVDNTDAEKVAEEPTTNPPADQPTAVAPTGDLSVVTADDHVEGPANAKVTVVVYDDFECPYCGRFQETLIQTREAYKDQVRFVFRHFPLSFHANAQPAAIASECAAEQGSFWDFADALFSDQENLGEDLYAKIVKDLGLDVTSFNTCVASGKYDQKIKDQAATGATAGVKGTPASFINGELVSGAVPFETLKTVIDSKL